MISVSSSEFNDIIDSSEKYVLVDFWAEWCAPCRIMAPGLEEIAHEYSKSLQVVKLNVDEELDITIKYQVSSIPSLILFKDGAEAYRSIGAKPKAEILKMLEEQMELF